MKTPRGKFGLVATDTDGVYILRRCLSCLYLMFILVQVCWVGKCEGLEDKKATMSCEGRFPKYIEFVCPLTCRTGQCRTVENNGTYKPFCICPNPDEKVGLRDRKGVNFYYTDCTAQQGRSRKLALSNPEPEPEFEPELEPEVELRVNSQVCSDLCQNYDNSYICRGEGKSTAGREFGPVDYCACNNGPLPAYQPPPPQQPPPCPVTTRSVQNKAPSQKQSDYQRRPANCIPQKFQSL